MPRFTDSIMIDYFNGQDVYFTELLEIDSPTAYSSRLNGNGSLSKIYMTNDDSNYELEGNVYIGDGAVGQIIPTITESGKYINFDYTVNFNGADIDILSLFLNNDDILGRQVRVFAAYQYADGRFAFKWEHFSGRISAIALQQGKDQVVGVTLASASEEATIPKGRRSNDASHQNFYPGDKGMEYSERQNSEETTFGRSN